MDPLALRYLNAMGIQAWADRNRPPTPARPAFIDADVLPGMDGLSTAVPTSDDESEWAALEAEVRACTRCDLHRSRKQAVFGAGNRRAGLMVIGEAPGAEEDAQGLPFVGRAGQLLNEMLAAIGLPREAVYIANILKSRPPGNRDPLPEEAAACADFLRRQLALVRPRVILAVGRIAAQQLLASEQRVGALRGRVHEYAGIPLVVTYHPSYLLRTPGDKRKAWEDLLLAARLLRQDSGR
ncbi:MAG: uracil-DNA glycosylase [Gammaproteobacteria bacterium]|jgi:DNA polymerase|nr:uracil-DNA glycosylase [Gammaproteobacteria bacterium]